MSAQTDIREYPEGYKGRKAYVYVQGHGVIAGCYTYRGEDGRVRLHPNYGGEDIVSRRSAVKAPYVMKDIGAYRSPIDGAMVTSRSEHREHLKTHDVIEVGNEHMPERTDARSKSDIESTARAIKNRLDEVKALPEAVYQEQVRTQQAEHAAVASLITAS